MHQEESIVQIIDRYRHDDQQGIPVFSKVALRLQLVLAEPDFSMETVHQLISADPGMASQVLRVANSSFYAGLSAVATLQDAIVRLGAREVANIVMVIAQSELHRSGDPRYRDKLQALWKHSFCCAVGSRWLALKLGVRDQVQVAFLAGLLHDIGKLFLLKVMERVGKEALGLVMTPAILEEILTSLHVEQGHQLMTQWHMPQIYCEVARLHDAEQWPQGNTLLAMVRLANLCCRRLGIGTEPDESVVLCSSLEAQVLGLKEVALAELEIAVEDALKTPMQNAA